MFLCKQRKILGVGLEFCIKKSLFFPWVLMTKYGNVKYENMLPKVGVYNLCFHFIEVLCNLYETLYIRRIFTNLLLLGAHKTFVYSSCCLDVGIIQILPLLMLVLFSCFGHILSFSESLCISTVYFLNFSHPKVAMSHSLDLMDKQYMLFSSYLHVHSQKHIYTLIHV